MKAWVASDHAFLASLRGREPGQGGGPDRPRRTLPVRVASKPVEVSLQGPCRACYSHEDTHE